MAKKAQTPVDPFAAIAAPAKSASSKKSHPVANVTPDIRLAVDKVIATKASITKLEHDLAEAETIIIDHVRPQQDEAALSGNFSKSFSVEGVQGNVTYTTRDTFSVPKDPIELDHVKDLCGTKWFDERFKKVRSVSLTAAVQADAVLLNKIIKAVTDAGITMAEAFTVTDTVVALPDLDVHQYYLPKDKLEEFRTMVRQSKPSLK